jgi:bifunctional DNA primase/polymerase-like protein/AAA domain-containing protein
MGDGQMEQKNVETTKLKMFSELAEYFPSLISLKGKVPIEKDWTLYCEESRFFNEKDFRGCNAGLACGPANRIIVIDVDDPAKFEAACKSKGWDLPPTRRHQTGTGKPHIFYKYPKNGKRYGNRSFKKDGFDIRGIGGQVVAPGSIHPDTGKPYKVLWDLPIEDAPQWLLDLAIQSPEQSTKQPDTPTDVTIDLESLPISAAIKAHIRNGVPKGERSEIIASVLSALLRAKASDTIIFRIFAKYPIGEKYLEKGKSRVKWLKAEINRARGFNQTDVQKKKPRGFTMAELKKEFGQGKDIRFLWGSVIPMGMPIMVAGREGSGKTTICLQWVKEIIDTHKTGYVIWLSTEGTVTDTINKACVMSLENPRFIIARKYDDSFKFNLEKENDRKQLDRILSELPETPIIVFIDSVRGMSKYSDNDDVLGKVMQIVNSIICDKHKAGAAYIDHYKKGVTIDPLDKVAGTTAKTAAVRLVLGVTKQSATTVHIKPTKSNFLNVEIPELESIKIGDKIHIRQLTKLTDQSLTDKAQLWLTKLMSKNKEMYASDIYRLAEKQGYSDGILKRAKKELPVGSKKDGKGWKWCWQIQE